MRLVAIRHVRRDRSVPVGVACMRSHPFAGMKNLHGGRGEPGFQLLAGHLVREPYPFMKLLYLFACGALAM